MGWLVSGDYQPQFRKLFSIKSGQISGAPTNIPVALVIASDASLATHARSDGHDIAITKGDGTTELDYERVLWNEATGALEVWLKAPDPENGDDYYLYYGDADQAVDRQNGTGVWDTYYKAVHHLHGASHLALKDSTSNNQDVTGEQGAPAYQQAGAVGYGMDFDGEDAVTIPDSPVLDITSPLILEVWFKDGAFADNARLVSKGQTGTDYAYFLIEVPQRYPGAVAFGSALGYRYTDNTSWNDGEWHRAVGVWLSGSIELIYVDGVPRSTTEVGAIDIETDGEPLAIGCEPRDGGFQDFLTGSLDEVWITSGFVRNQDWFASQYNNQKSPAPGGTFWSALGSEERNLYFTTDAIIKKALTGAFTADAYLASVARALFADAVIFKAQPSSIIADAILKKTPSSSLAADAILKKTESDALDADAVVFQTSSGSLAADGVLFKTISDAIPGDAYLTYGVFADGVIFKTQQASFSADAIIFPIQHIFMKAGPIYIPVYPLT